MDQVGAEDGREVPAAHLVGRLGRDLVEVEQEELEDSGGVAVHRGDRFPANLDDPLLVPLVGDRVQLEPMNKVRLWAVVLA